jgi:hypothetical protein
VGIFRNLIGHTLDLGISSIFLYMLLFNSNWMYYMLYFFLEKFKLYMFQMLFAPIISSTTAVYSNRFLWFWCVLFHRAGTGVGTL